jgi:serine-type D-Ala-D-Ala carboxypeptidase (penicillin-binding protein 5/6)
MNKKSCFSVLLYSVFFIFSSMSYASANTDSLLPFKVKAKAAVLINVNSGQVVFEQNADVPIPPASLTKLMTLNLAFDAADDAFIGLDDEVRVSEKAWKTEGSRMFLEVRKTVPLEIMLKGIAVVSANDACVAVSEHISGVEEVFAERMNEKADLIGMDSSLFKNSHGLPVEGQVTTARDMATLSVYYIRHHPEVLKYHSIKKMTFNKITQPNRNGLLWLDYGVDGLKTGWFSKAGFHIVATAQKGDDRFVAVVMGSKGERERENIALKMLNYGFRNFNTVKVINAEEKIAEMPVWKGAESVLQLGTVKTASVTVPREAKGDIQINKEFPDRIYAPVEKGQKIGEVKVLLNGLEIETYPLVALNEIKKAGFFKLMYHNLLLLFILPPYLGGIALVLILVFILILVRSAMRVRGKDGLSGLR